MGAFTTVLKWSSAASTAGGGMMRPLATPRDRPSSRFDFAPPHASAPPPQRHAPHRLLVAAIEAAGSTDAVAVAANHAAGPWGHANHDGHAGHAGHDGDGWGHPAGSPACELFDALLGAQAPGAEAATLPLLPPSQGRFVLPGRLADAGPALRAYEARGPPRA